MFSKSSIPCVVGAGASVASGSASPSTFKSVTVKKKCNNSFYFYSQNTCFSFLGLKLVSVVIMIRIPSVFM